MKKVNKKNIIVESWNELDDHYDEFNEYLDEIYPVVKIGDLKFYPSKILEKCDPIAYGLWYDDWVDENGYGEDSEDGEDSEEVVTDSVDETKVVTKKSQDELLDIFSDLAQCDLNNPEEVYRKLREANVTSEDQDVLIRLCQEERNSRYENDEMDEVDYFDTLSDIIYDYEIEECGETPTDTADVITDCDSTITESAKKTKKPGKKVDFTITESMSDDEKEIMRRCNLIWESRAQKKTNKKLK